MLKKCFKRELLQWFQQMFGVTFSDLPTRALWKTLHGGPQSPTIVSLFTAIYNHASQRWFNSRNSWSLEMHLQMQSQSRKISGLKKFHASDGRRSMPQMAFWHERNKKNSTCTFGTPALLIWAHSVVDLLKWLDIMLFELYLPINTFYIVLHIVI